VHAPPRRTRVSSSGGVSGCTVFGMCRSIKTLRQPDVPATDEEIRAAALQFVRKVSGYREPSRKNIEAFGGAVDEVAATTKKLLEAVSPAQSAESL
jgi:hypothetical protein